MRHLGSSEAQLVHSFSHRYPLITVNYMYTTEFLLLTSDLVYHHISFDSNGGVVGMQCNKSLIVTYNYYTIQTEHQVYLVDFIVFLFEIVEKVCSVLT